MDSGTAAFLGAIVGGGCSIVATWLSEHLRTKRSRRLDKIRKDRLRRMLSDERYQWRNFSTLCDAIGADEETTAELLLEIDARRSTSDKNAWGLVSRNPFND